MGTHSLVGRYFTELKNSGTIPELFFIEQQVGDGLYLAQRVNNLTTGEMDTGSKALYPITPDTVLSQMEKGIHLFFYDGLEEAAEEMAQFGVTW